jgi:cysteine dioxygenase
MLSIAQFIATLRDLQPATRTVDHLSALTARDPIDTATVMPYLTWRPDGYTRNGIYRDATFEVLAMAWSPGASSPVHGHDGHMCWLAVLAGDLRITAFALPPQVDVGQEGSDIGLQPCGVQQVSAGACEVTAADIDVHSVTNVTPGGGQAVSLHVYSPPFDSAIIYDVAAATATRRPLG